MEHRDSNKILIGKLKNIVKSMSKHYTVKLGLLASKNKQITPNLDISGLGCIMEYGAHIQVTQKMRNYFRHEFGINLKKSTTEIVIPARSWLYEPIKDPNFRKYILDWVGDEEFFKEYVDKDVMRELANIIGEVGLMQIFKAFDNGGINGEWQPNSALTIQRKHSSKPLVADGDLKGHVTYEVE